MTLFSDYSYEILYVKALMWYLIYRKLNKKVTIMCGIANNGLHLQNCHILWYFDTYYFIYS